MRKKIEKIIQDVYNEADEGQPEESVVPTAVDEILEAVREIVPKKKKNISTHWLCKDHGFYGNYSEYCKYCRKRLVEEETEWEDEINESWNKCIEEIESKLK